ncbi:MAG: hypothetical protein AAF999_02625 [Pseudomonadota bacterium]
MSKEMMAVIGFGVIGAIALLMLVVERRSVSRRKAARGGRDVDLSSVFDPTRENGQRTDP